MLKFRNTLEIVNKDIQDIEKLVSNFKNSSALSNIELDIVLSKLRDVYDVLSKLREETRPVAPPTEIHETSTGNTIAENPVVIQADLPKAIEAETPAAHSEKFKSQDDIFDAEEMPVKARKVSKPKKSTAEADKTIGEKFTADHSFINEKLGESILRTDISSILQSSPIKNISGNLGINDKFYFIKELFNGDAELFRQTIHDLDNSSNFNSAYSFLLNKFSWDMESESVQKLLNLVRRKFISPGNE